MKRSSFILSAGADDCLEFQETRGRPKKADFEEVIVVARSVLFENSQEAS